MKQPEILRNYIGGTWTASKSSEYLDVCNPATTEILSRVPLSLSVDVDTAVRSALEAFKSWRRTPAVERVQYLFKLRGLVDEHSKAIAQTITQECGKTLLEAQGELRRGIENIEVATGIPSLMMGCNLEDVSRGIDEFMIRQPLGVVAAIPPFNFPAMIPLWFLPYAIACGNTIVLKPSEKVPMTMSLIFHLIDQIGLPRGVANLVHGSKEVTECLIDHPDVRAISFVGSSPVAKAVYARAAAKGKRVQCQGGAKNMAIVLPDADMEMTTKVLAESAFGCAGQRCLATSVALTVGEARKTFTKQIVDMAAALKVGYGLESGVEMGPVITALSKNRVQRLIAEGSSEYGEILLDGREPNIPGYEHGNFIRPTIVNQVNLSGGLAQSEIFGPVLALSHADSIEEAIRQANASAFGNMACIFTRDGHAARKFRNEVEAGNVGINVGVAAPMAFFPFSGWKDSFFGDLHAQGRDAIDFYTDKKIVIERW